MNQKKKQTLTVMVGANITAKRKVRGWNQAQFAERLGIGADSLSRIERGLTAPRFQTLEKMALILECAVSDFFMTHKDIPHSGHVSYPAETGDTAIPEVTKQEIIFMAEKIIQLMRSNV